MNAQKKQLGGSNRKKGRNKAKCQRYSDRNIRVFNKKRKLNKHLKKHSGDIVAQACLKKL